MVTVKNTYGSLNSIELAPIYIDRYRLAPEPAQSAAVRGLRGSLPGRDRFVRGRNVELVVGRYHRWCSYPGQLAQARGDSPCVCGDDARHVTDRHGAR